MEFLGKNWRQSRRARKRAAMQRAQREAKAGEPGVEKPAGGAGESKPKPRGPRRRRSDRLSDDW